MPNPAHIRGMAPRFARTLLLGERGLDDSGLVEADEGGLEPVRQMNEKKEMAVALHQEMTLLTSRPRKHRVPRAGGRAPCA